MSQKGKTLSDKNLDELTMLRTENEDLRQRCEKIQQECQRKAESLESECRFRNQSDQALHLAQVIIENSPVVLFQRLFADPPKLVYVSNNIKRFGYQAEDFLTGKTSWKDIVHPEDSERMGKEIVAYADSEAEGYQQEYRIISPSGEVFWVQDQTRVVRDENGQKTHTQGIVVDITDHKKALELAGEVQKSLLPREKPVVQGLDVAGRNVSCDEIGGDYFDFLWKRENPRAPFSVVVGDIAGHGVDSALLMTTARAFLRMRASQAGSLREIVDSMNHHLVRDVFTSGRFMTLFFLTIDPVARTLDWIRAGHDPAVLYDPATNEFEELLGRGMALGLDEEYRYEVHSRGNIVDGQIIAIGTDGIWEACNRNGEMFGKDRFFDIIRKHAALRAEDILEAVYRELDAFAEEKKMEDDVTLVIVKFNP